jgi:CheY-like chemotaxis protein
MIVEDSLRPEPAPAPTVDRQLHILVAEDNIMNQQLITRLLENEGHTVKVAYNGEVALAMLELEPFDLIIMDVQMPHMDGIEATAAIREREQGLERHMPIIALTAHAMKGDRERCLEAGMDAYVSKPIDANELFSTIEEMTSATLFKKASATSSTGDVDGTVGWAPENPAEMVDSPHPLLQVINRDKLDQLTRGDRGFVSELAATFSEDCDALLGAIRGQIRSRDMAGLTRTSHTLKGMLGNIAAEAAFAAAQRLEVTAHNNDFEGTETALAALEAELDRLEPVINQLSG